MATESSNAQDLVDQVKETLTAPRGPQQAFATKVQHGIEGVRALLLMVGEDPERDGLVDTPKRVAKALLEMTSGYSADPEEILGTVFKSDCDEMVVLKDIPFVSMCEHHMLPFTGHAAVGYIPKQGNGVVGISKLARLVDCYARRLQIQETMTHQIARAIQDVLDPVGVGVRVEAVHSCMSCRGVMKTSSMVTSALLGAMRKDAAVRAEFFSLVG